MGSYAILAGGKGAWAGLGCGVFVSGSQVASALVSL